MTATKRPTFAEATETVRDLAEEANLTYHPTAEERGLKSLFWVTVEDNPVCDRDSVTTAAVYSLTKDTRIHKWWGKPGFKEWFTNSSEFQAKVETTLNKLIDSFAVIADSDDPKSFSAKVQAAKVLADIRGYTKKAPPAKNQGLPDDPAELRALIAKLQPALLPKE